MSLRNGLKWFYGETADVADVAIQTFLTLIAAFLIGSVIVMLIISSNARFLFGFFGGIFGVFWLLGKIIYWYMHK